MKTDKNSVDYSPKNVSEERYIAYFDPLCGILKNQMIGNLMIKKKVVRDIRYSEK